MLCAIALILWISFVNAYSISDLDQSLRNYSIECGGTLSGTVDSVTMLFTFLTFTIETEESQNVYMTTDGSDDVMWFPVCFLLPDGPTVNATVYNGTNQMTCTFSNMVPAVHQVGIGIINPSNASEGEPWTIEMDCTSASPTTSPTSSTPTEPPSPAPTASPTDFPYCSNNENCC